jgi:hypothetical protein
MKKNKLNPLQKISITYFHRTRYQQSQQRERSGEPRQCPGCERMIEPKPKELSL